MMTNGDHEGQIFLSHPHTNNGFFFLLTIKYHIILEKYEKDFQKILNRLRWDNMTSLKHFNDAMDRHAANVRLFDFYLSHGLVWVCEKELSHMGKINGNPYLVCKEYQNLITVTEFSG